MGWLKEMNLTKTLPLEAIAALVNPLLPLSSWCNRIWKNLKREKHGDNLFCLNLS